jgi:hypothetical protein
LPATEAERTIAAAIAWVISLMLPPWWKSGSRP